VVTPHNSPAPFTLIVLIAVVIIKEVLFRFVSKAGAEIESSVVSADAWHHRSDAITSLFALVGISVAVLGGKGYEVADEIAAILAGGVIAFNGWRVLRPAMDELMDIAPSADFLDNIRAIAAATPEVVRVEKCFVRKTGFEYLVDMHIEVNPEMTVHRAHDIAHNVKDEIRRQVPAVRDVLVHVEPAGRHSD
jgi:cation diffusion facilitator family transporter